MAEVDRWLTRFARLNTAAMEQRARARDSTTAEDEVLGALVQFGPTMSPTALRALVHQSPGGLTKTLKRLEDAGFVERVHDPDDRRALLVSLTGPGHDAAARVLADRDAHYDTALGSLDDTDLDELRRLVRHVLDNLEDALGTERTTPPR